jgi:3-keto-disaccharide hydrolase
MHRFFALVVLVVASGMVHAQGNDYKPLFNGKDLTGWVNVNCAPSTWLVKDNMIITTGKPTGYLRTDRQYENFIVEFDWFHAPKKTRDKEVSSKSGPLIVHKLNDGNSGMFVWGDPIPAVGTGYTRSIEVQVLVGLRSTVATTGETAYTSHGDLFSIWGAKCKPDRPHPLGWERCLPSEERCKGEYEWNHYKVVGNNGALKLHVNGKEVSGVSECNPRKGYLALESEGSECRFKNIKIKELPSTNPMPNEVCDVDRGLKCLFTGLDLTGWKADAEAKKHWKMSDGVLNTDGQNSILWSDNSYRDLELVCDFRNKANLHIRGDANSLILLDGDKGWNRAIVSVKGGRLTVSINGKLATDNMELKGATGNGPIGLAGRNEATQFRNLFVRELK